MVSRIEIFLLAALLFFFSRGTLQDLTRNQSRANSQGKTLEIRTLSFREVNQTALLNTITAAHMTQYPDKTLYEHFALYSPDLTLKALRVIQKNKKLFLDNNVTILKADGSHYTAGNVVYDRDKRALDLSGRFSFSNRYGEVQGRQLQYCDPRKEMQGEGIRARYEIE